MTQFKPEWLEHQRKRWMRPDAHAWIRHDAHAWIRHDAHRFMPPGSPIYVGRDVVKYFWPDPQADERKYSPDQPRVPAGNSDGGQWTHEGGGINDSRVLSDATPDPITPGMQFAAKGHHHVPRGIFENKEKYSFRPETLKVFENEATGTLNDPSSNWYDEPHRQYNRAVEEALDSYLERNKIRSDQMTPDQARSFAKEIKTSPDLRIRQFIRRMISREMRFWYRQGPRGRE